MSVTITSSPPSQTSSTDATVAFTATGAKKTQCKLDGGSLADCTSPASYSGLSVGTHTFVVKAIADNNSGKTANASATWQVVSAGPAALSVSSSIANGATLSGSVTWEAKPSRTVGSVDFYIDGTLKWTERIAPYIFNGDPGGLLDTKTLTDGSHVLKVAATASDGAKAESSATVQVANSSSSSFNVTSSISNGSNLSGSVPWQATTSANASAVDFYVDGTLKWTEHYAPYVFNGDGSTLNTTTLADGSHALRVVATASSNGATSETSSTVTVANGTPPAAFTVTSSITNGATLSGSVVWEATPSKAVTGVGFYVDGTLRYTDTAAPYRFNGDTGKLDTTTLAEGAHTLRVLATAADSTTAEATLTVQVSNSAPSVSGGEGDVRFMEMTNSSTDGFTNSPSATQQQWMRDHWQRARVFAGYWDARLSWYPNGWAYEDAYAIYNPSTLATDHPDWILKDANGSKLYIPWGCSGGTCPQYAADIGSAAWRQYFINVCKGLVAKGYKGVYVDDVDMDMNTGNGQGQHVTPIDPRTGQLMTDTAWKAYFADFMSQLRAALPGAEITHNAVWFAGGGLHDGTNPSIAQQIKAASFISLERGFNDSGLTGGTGSWSIYALMRYIDNVHSYGAHIVLQSYASDVTSAEYNLAGYFLVSDGTDLVSTTIGSLASDWWSGYDTNLGNATTGRYLWNGVWRRDFTGGIVLLNEPGATTKTINLGRTFRTTSGASLSTITLGASRGAVLSNP